MHPCVPCVPHAAAAACLQEIAEVLEKEGDKEECLLFYEQAADLFATENSLSEANKCNLKVGGWVGGVGWGDHYWGGLRWAGQGRAVVGRAGQGRAGHAARATGWWRGMGAGEGCFWLACMDTIPAH